MSPDEDPVDVEDVGRLRRRLDDRDEKAISGAARRVPKAGKGRPRRERRLAGPHGSDHLAGVALPEHQTDLRAALGSSHPRPGRVAEALDRCDPLGVLEPVVEAVGPEPRTYPSPTAAPVRRASVEATAFQPESEPSKPPSMTVAAWAVDADATARATATSTIVSCCGRTIAGRAGPTDSPHSSGPGSAASRHPSVPTQGARALAAAFRVLRHVGRPSLRRFTRCGEMP